MPVRAKIAAEDSQIVLCTAEKWPGLLPFEFYVTIVTHESSSEDPLALNTNTVVLNTKTNRQYPAPKPNPYYYMALSKNYSKMLTELVKSSLAKQVSPPKQKFETQLICKGERPEPRLSLIMEGEGYQWQVEFEKTGRCEVVQIGENPRFLTSDIIIHPSRLRFDSATGEPDLKNLTVEILPRQAFSDYRNDHDYLKDLIQSSNDHCDEIAKSMAVLAKRSPVYEQNRWHSEKDFTQTPERFDASVGQQAISLDLPTQVSETFLSTPGQGDRKLASQIFLEERNSLDQTRLIGTWQVSSYFEMRNLVYYENSKNPKRVIFRDPRCGKEYASNWITD